MTSAAFEGDVVTIVALMAFLSFAIDRIVAMTMFLLSFSRVWNRRFPEPALQTAPAERYRAEKKNKLVYFILATILAAGVLAFADQVRVLTALGFRTLKSNSAGTAPPNGATTTAVATPSPTPTAGNDNKPNDSSLPFRILDFALTGLILIGGAERIDKLMAGRSGHSSSSTSESKPLEITGKITIDDQSKREG